MKRTAFLAVISSAMLGAATVATAQVPGPDRTLTDPKAIASPRRVPAAPIPLRDLFRAAQSDSAVWSADGRSIIHTSDRDGTMAIWIAPADGSGAARRIGGGDRKQAQIALAADGQTVLFQSDIGGRQVNDLFAMPLTGGEAANLTDTPDVDEAMAKPSPDGRFVAFARREKAQSSNNIAVMDVATRKVRTLTDEKVAGVQWWPIAVSKDGSRIVVNRFDWSQTLGEAWVIETASGKATRLTPEGRYAEAGGISPDGTLASVAIEDAQGISQAMVVDIASGRQTPLPHSAWDEKPGAFSPDGRKVILVRNVDGREEVRLYDVARGRVHPLNLPEGTNSRSFHGPFLPSFSPDGRKVLFPHSSSAQPLDYWVQRMKGGKPVRVTRIGDLGDAKLVRTQLVHYASKDGTIISAFLWLPDNLARDGSAPAVLRPHGGPTSQTMDGFDRTSAALASRGYVVLAPNFRGSTGYGRAFLDANQKDLGGGDLDDVAAGARFLVETGFVDARRIGIAGGSYGGYMTLIALAKQPDVWAAGVDLFGIANWRTMWEHGTLANRRYQRTLIGDPALDPAAYDKASPLTYLDNVRAPLLVLHGENDPIVPVIEARQISEFLGQRNRTVEIHVYPEEGHGFGRREAQMDSLERTIAWFETYLKGEGKPH